MIYYKCINEKCEFIQKPCYIRRDINKKQWMYDIVLGVGEWNSILDCTQMKLKKMSEEDIMLTLL